MPTSYTSLIGLALPQTGELSGTWGDTVNDYITRYLDAAIAGAQTISGNQTAVSLLLTNGSTLVTAGSGASGSAQYSIINCTGNPAATLVVTVPTSSKVYLVLNATSTSQSVTVKPSGAAGITVAAGRAALIAWNGSDFVRVATNDLGALTGTISLTSNVTGTLPVANGGTGVTTSTGTGATVRSTSPALVTPDLGTPTALTLTSATGLPLTTGVTGTLPILNGGTGATTAANAFTALKQAATDTATGVVELATTAEVQTGTDTTRAITPAGLAASALGSVTSGLTNVVGSRTTGVNYTNSSGKPLFIWVRATVSANASAVELYVSGNLVASENVNTVNAAGYVLTTVAVVRPNATYRIELPLGNATLTSVWELN